MANCSREVQIGSNCLLYGVVANEDEIILADGDVLVEIVPERDSPYRMASALSIDGGKEWKEVVKGNSKSFEQVNKENDNADIIEIEKRRQEFHCTRSKSLSTGLERAPSGGREGGRGSTV